MRRYLIIFAALFAMSLVSTSSHCVEIESENWVRGENADRGGSFGFGVDENGNGILSLFEVKTQHYTFLKMSKDDLGQVKDALKKIIDWYAVARENKVGTITKQLPTDKHLPLKISFMYSDQKVKQESVLYFETAASGSSDSLALIVDEESVDHAYNVASKTYNNFDEAVEKVKKNHSLFT